MNQKIETLINDLYNPTAPLYERESRLAELESIFLSALQSRRDELKKEQYCKLSDWHNPRP